MMKISHYVNFYSAPFLTNILNILQFHSPDADFNAVGRIVTFAVNTHRQTDRRTDGHSDTDTVTQTSMHHTVLNITLPLR